MGSFAGSDGRQAWLLALLAVAVTVALQRQGRFLQALGVTVGQGFLFAPGLAPDEFARRLTPRH